MTPLTKAFITLILLSATTTALSGQLTALATGGALALLVLSGWKARVILNGYLGLGPSRFWRRGFNGTVMLFLIVAFGLYLLPVLRA